MNEKLILETAANVIQAMDDFMASKGCGMNLYGIPKFEGLNFIEFLRQSAKEKEFERTMKEDFKRDIENDFDKEF